MRLGLGMGLARPVGASSPYGPELVSNGTFDSDLTGWATYGEATASVVSGRAFVTNNNGNDGISQAFSVEGGATYEVSGDIENGTSPQCKILIGTGIGNGNRLNSLPTSTGSVSGQFTSDAGDTTLRVNLQLNGVAGSTGYFDNISIRKVL